MATVSDHLPDTQSAGSLRVQLQSLLDEKEKQLRLAGTLGQRILAQQVELEERIAHLNELDDTKFTTTDDEQLETEIRGKLQDLKNTMSSWETENQEMFGNLGDNTATTPHTPVVEIAPPELDTPSLTASPSAPSAAQSSRRAKNAAHRANDVEFAYEIGSSLLTEVRRLQSLLGERDKALQDIKEEREDLNRMVDSLRDTLRTQEASSDKYKEENWNLEVTLQEVRTQLGEVQSNAQNSELERKRTAKQLVQAREAADQHKTELERVTTSLDEFKAKHETDVAQMRKQAASLIRDKSDLQSHVEILKQDLQKKERSIKRFGSPLTPNGLSPYNTPAINEDEEGADDDVFTGGASRRKMDNSAMFSPEGLGSDFADSSPEPSPSRPQHLAPNHPSNEIEALKQSLAHAQRQVNMLRGTVHREKELRMDMKRKLAAAGVESGMLGDDVVEDDDEEEENRDPSKPRNIVANRAVRGRGRGGARRTGVLGRSTLAQKLAGAPRGSDDEMEEPELWDEEQDDAVLDSPDIAVTVPEPEHDELEPVDDVGHPRPVSMDGMDPAFANVLHRQQSPSAHGSSPLRNATPPVRARRGRGGVPRAADSRPSSLVDTPGALAAELGMAGASMDTITELAKKVETAEFGCQTEPEVVSQPIVALPPVDVHEIGIQAEDLTPRPEPVSTVEVSTQTVEVVPMRSEASTEPMVPTLSEAEVQTLLESHTRPESLATPFRMSVSGDDQTPRGTMIASKPVLGNLQVPYDGSTTETETDGEYTDAREYMATTPTHESTHESFVSARSRPTDTETELDSDQESIKVSQLGLTARPSELGAVREGFTADSDADSDKESLKASQIGRNRRISNRSRVASIPAPPPRPMAEAGIQAEEVKAETKETSMQTDTPAAPTAVPSTPSTSYGLFRIGSNGQQFQFVSPQQSPASFRESSGNTSSAANASSATVVPRRNLTATPSSRDREHPVTIESALLDDSPSRPRTLSAQSLKPVDKTRPPTMMLPPPPRAPPPPGSEKKSSTTSSRDMPPPRDIPPPRPKSSPPPELIQRATTPTFNGAPMLRVSSRGSTRQHGTSLPPQNLQKKPSTNSFRSAANAAAAAGMGAFGISTLEALERRQRSTTSLVSSRRTSLHSRHSSISSEQLHGRNGAPPTTPGRPGESGDATDPTVINSITQTMIGEFLYKYTKRTFGKGPSTQRHKRFFWVHPYTKTLYWSNADPGASNVSESSAKSAYIESVRAVMDPNPMPPGLHQWSVIVQTPHREMKFTAPTKERHDIWFNALNYLLTRPGTGHTPRTGGPSAARPGLNDENVFNSPRSMRSGRSAESWNVTPRVQRSQSRLSGRASVGKRSGTPAAEYLRLGGPDGMASPSKSDYEYVPGLADDDDELDFEMHDEHAHEGYEGLENVRACCDGRHDLGTLSRKGHHHHHHHHHHHQHETPTSPTQPRSRQLQEPAEPHARPVSPSAWSFRSRAGSTASKGEGKLSSWTSKFGSKRSTKGVPPVPTSPAR